MIKKLSKLLFALGFILIIVSGVLAIKYYLNINNQENVAIVKQLYEMMPECQNGIILDIDDEMPIAEVNHENFVGIISIPKYNRTLPIGALWNNDILTKYPSVYLGTLYDGSLIISATDSKNQLDFMKTINEDDVILISDMKGKKFSYIIDEIEITKDVSTEHLISYEHDLVIFVKNTYSFDYTILKCKYKIA